MKRLVKRDLSETMPDTTRALFVRLHDWLDTQVDVEYYRAGGVLTYVLNRIAEEA